MKKRKKKKINKKIKNFLGFKSFSDFINNKKIKLVVIITIIIVFAILTAFFILGVKIRFVLNDEMNIQLHPLNTIFFVENNQPVNITFAVRNDNFVQCKSRCEFTLSDVRDNSLLYSENRILKHNEEFVESFTLNPPGKGSGQIIYIFEVKCRNLNSLVCLTDGKPRQRSSIVLVDYELRKEERGIKNNLKRKIEDLLAGIKNVAIILRQNTILAERLPYNIVEKKGINIKIQKLSNQIDFLKARSNVLVSKWDNEDYFALNGVYSEEYPKLIEDIEESAIGVQNNTLSILMLRNSTINILEEVMGLKEELSKISNYYINESNPINAKRLEKLSRIAENIYNSYLMIELSQNFSEQSLNENLKQNLQESKNIISEYSKNQLKGLALLLFGKHLLATKRDNNGNIGYLDKFQCDALKELISEIDKENNDSLNYTMVNYSEHLGDLKFENEIQIIEGEIEEIALNKTKEYITALSIEGLIKILDEEIIKTISTNVPLDTPTKDLHRMALLNNSRNKNYFEENCKNSSFAVEYHEGVNKLVFISLSSTHFKGIDTTIPQAEVEVITELDENPPICCVFNDCQPCYDEGYGNKSIFPVLFVHGHMVDDKNTPEFSMSGFAKIQVRMQEDDFINAGELVLDPEEIPQGEWGRSGRPIVVRATYYYIVNYGIGTYTLQAQKSERIENYAIRLKEIIDLLKQRTNSNKINIVAHSMGGLVTREYLSLFGDSDTDKVILINTPNHGIDNKVKKLCPVFGSKKECGDMAVGSIFLSRLNSRKLPENAEMHVIRSIGCKMEGNKIGDGIVTNESAYLEGAENYIINGNCTDPLNTNLHTGVLDPDLYPQTYRLILDILKGEYP